MLISPPSVCSITTLFKLSTLALTLFNADEPLIALAISVASSAAPFVVTEMIACEVVFVPFLVSLIVKEYVLAAIPLGTHNATCCNWDATGFLFWKVCNQLDL